METCEKAWHVKMNKTIERVNNAAKKTNTNDYLKHRKLSKIKGRKPVETRTWEHKIKHGNKQIEKNISSCSAGGFGAPDGGAARAGSDAGGGSTCGTTAWAALTASRSVLGLWTLGCGTSAIAKKGTQSRASLITVEQQDVGSTGVCERREN